MHRLRALPPYSLVIDNRTNNAVVLATRLLLQPISTRRPPGLPLLARRLAGAAPPDAQTARLMKLLAAVTGVPIDGAGEIELPPAMLETAGRLLPPGAPCRARPRRLGARALLALGAISSCEAGSEAQGAKPAFILGPVELGLLPRLPGLPQALFPGCSENETIRDVELSLALGRRMAAAVSNDTGTGHLLGAAGTPLLSLFGPDGPTGLAAGRRPQRRHLGPRPWRAGMTRIPFAAVTAALQGLMKQG
jgi:hypothetical protein